MPRESIRHRLAGLRSCRSRVWPAAAACTVIGLAGCGSGSVPVRSTTSGATTVTRQAFVAAVAASCAKSRHQILALAAPTGATPTSPAVLKYATRVSSLLDASLAHIRSIRGRQPVFGQISRALAVEKRGQQLVDAEIPALRRGNVRHAQALAARARALTAPADAVFRAAGLAVCVGG